ncbi:MAG: RecQ family ATP-dependent DNA helicase [Prevotellaceae bacterium]|jgi:ATP-dependent DNA helicase RecQ|nr:RecQ family ATP-dependent DNA helicase [Prevotellaceae bacterium]
MYQEILKKYWGYDSFRGIQAEVIDSIGRGEDTLGLMPTGGGKSVTFQVPTMAMEGLCLVVTPLIALMKDQVNNLRSRGIRALAIYSGMTRGQIISTLENCIFGNYKFLYISPERLDTELFQAKLSKMKVCLITVDESHCISQWGYDFRPAYLRIAQIRALLPDVPVLALTATATPRVVKDIQEKLLFRRENVFRMSFERTNLSYVVRQTDNKRGELLNILRKVPGSAIVYVRNRKKSKEVADVLQAEGITAEFYHAGIDQTNRDLRQTRWQNNESRVMVATNAFGMGIDKANVQLVIHLDLPDSIEAYFQEAGRAGRAGQRAYAVILYAAGDRTTLKRRVAENYPDKDYIRRVYEDLQYYYQMAMGDGQGCVREFAIDDFCRRFRHFPVQVDSALKILTLAGYLEYTEEQENESRLRFAVHRDELYRLSRSEERADRVIQTVLRLYTGLFTDYAYIREEEVAQRTGLTRHEVYETLKMLAARHIVSYIPRKKTPYIIYTRAREEAASLVIPHTVYEARKARYTERIDAMIGYVDNRDTCRSRLLLAYFAEKRTHNCGHCDVCLDRGRKEKAIPHNELRAVAAQICDMLATAPLAPDAIAGAVGADADVVAATLRLLMEEQRVTTTNGLVSLNG